MTKKTVTFKMPVKNAERVDIGSTEGASLSEGQDSPTVLFSHGGSKYSEATSESDQWVRRRNKDNAPVEVAASSFTLTTNGVTIDLAAERSFQQIAALTFMVPPMLSWFWLLNAANRYWNRLS